MILSRVKSDSAKNQSQLVENVQATKQKVPTFEGCIQKRDYTGARTLLEFNLLSDNENVNTKKEWLAFCNFHLGDYKSSLEMYTTISTMSDLDENQLNKAVCMFYLGMYDEAQAAIENVTTCPLKVRLLFHLAHKRNDDDRLMELHSSLRDVIEDQLSLAGMHYLRAHYQEAIDIYKRILLDKKHLIALNVYIALCYYKLDYYDISQEVLDLYLVHHPDSTIAINLKACNQFRLINGRVAEQELRNLQADNQSFGADLVKHNLVVFKNGEAALQVLPGLVDIVTEARLNLAIYYLRRNDINSAHKLMKDVQPTVPHEYILKGVVYAALGQLNDSKEHIKNAQQCLHLVGGSTSECDTIPGRQSMASAFFLYGQFEEVLVYLNSIRSYFVNDDIFNYNYAQAKAATGYYKEAEELLVQINDPAIRSDSVWTMLLARCHIHQNNADQAWHLFVAKDNSTEGFALLQLIANDSYKVGEFWLAAKAFDMLERLDPNPEYWEGKRGACAGALQAVLAKRPHGAPPDGIAGIISLLRDSTNSQAEGMLRTMSRLMSAQK